MARRNDRYEGALPTAACAETCPVALGSLAAEQHFGSQIAKQALSFASEALFMS